MRVYLAFLILALVSFISVSAENDKNDDKNKTKSNAMDSESPYKLQRKFENGDLAFLESYDNGCGTCVEKNLTSSDCKKWDITLLYKDYKVFNFLCGCSKRINADSQCRRFYTKAISEVETFATKECNVHLRCFVVDYDAEPLTHKCHEVCYTGLFGCDASCNTNCYYGIECDALANTDVKDDKNKNKF